MKTLSVPEQHQLKIAKRTLELHDTACLILGGPNKTESRKIIRAACSTEAEFRKIIMRHEGTLEYVESDGLLTAV